MRFSIAMAKYLLSILRQAKTHVQSRKSGFHKQEMIRFDEHRSAASPRRASNCFRVARCTPSSPRLWEVKALRSGVRHRSQPFRRTCSQSIMQMHMHHRAGLAVRLSTALHRTALHAAQLACHLPAGQADDNAILSTARSSLRRTCRGCVCATRTRPSSKRGWRFASAWANLTCIGDPI
jgi:hypothetical protein